MMLSLVSQRASRLTKGPAACARCLEQTMRTVIVRGSHSRPQLPRPKRHIPGLMKISFFSTLSVFTFYLGSWQVRRYKWKTELIETKRAEYKKDPENIPFDLSELMDMEWQRVRVKGRFDHSREQHVGPRPLIKPDASKDHAAYAGIIVITPFQLSESGKWILVNRGWVNQTCMDPRSRPEGQVEGEVEFVGIVRMSEKRPKGIGKMNQTAPNMWRYKSCEEFSKACNTEPYIVDVAYEDSIPGGPIGGQTPNHLRNKHLEYVLMWYGLSFVTFVFVAGMVRKYVRQRQSQREYYLSKDKQEELRALASSAKDSPAPPGSSDKGTPV